MHSTKQYSASQKLCSSILIIICAAFSINSFGEEDHGHNNPKEINDTLSFQSAQVGKGLYMLMGVGGFTGGNIGLSVGEDGVVMIDDSMPPMLDILQTAIKKITDKPVNLLINTHVHGDHTGNNASLAKSGAHIIAHANVRKHFMTHNKNASQSALPVMTFPEEMTFHLNGHEAHTFHLPKAHTNGDVVIHFKKANVIHTGDLMFNGMFPYIHLDAGGTPQGYLNAQKKIFALINSNTKIIPGHGPRANKQDLKASIDMLEDTIGIIQTHIEQGKTEEQVVKINPLDKYEKKWSWAFITTEKMTRQLYKGLSAK